MLLTLSTLLIMSLVTAYCAVVKSVDQTTSSSTEVNYSRHRVIRITITSRTQMEIVQKAEEDLHYGIDVWKESPKTNMTFVDLRVTPDVYDELSLRLTNAAINFDIMFSDLQRVIDEQKADEEVARRWALKRRRRRSARDSVADADQSDESAAADADDEDNSDVDIDEIVGRYANHSEINSWLQLLQNKRPNIVELTEIGTSYENRRLVVIKIGEPTSTDVIKPAIWIDAGIHAREWIAPATAIYIIRSLVTGYLNDPEVTSLLREYDWYIMPLVNPDGYTYSRTTDRMWRKTRSRVSSGTRTCYGVDGNRNFDYQWLSECRNMASMSRCRGRMPCDNVFAGHQPLSEPETIAIANFIHSHRSTIKMYITLHSYSQLWLTPWGYTADEPDDGEDMMRVGEKGLEALESVHHTEYEIGSPALILYAATGGSYDWAKGKEGIKYSYTIELRDKGRYGFMLPVNQIVPTGEETWNGIEGAVRELSRDVCWVRGQNCSEFEASSSSNNSSSSSSAATGGRRS